MKRIITFAILMVVLASCIGQQEESGWSVQDWKEHLFLVTPPLGQDVTSMISGFRDPENLPIGTRTVFAVTHEGTFGGAYITTDMTMDIHIVGTEVINGQDCTVVDVVIEMEMESQDQSMSMDIKGTEWLDKEGAPLRVKEDVIMGIGEFDIPMSIEMERTGEELYHGHECWVFSGTQTMEIMGLVETEGTIEEYMDKETFSVVRTLTEIEGEKVDTGYIEPPIPVEDLVWELGNRETITTELGTYECQVIYLKENGEIVGTIWAHEDVKAPIKYVFSYETANMNLEMTMILVEYIKA